MIKYEKSYLDEIFDKDFENMIYNSRTLIGNRNINHIAQGVICEMVFQLCCVMFLNSKKCGKHEL